MISLSELSNLKAGDMQKQIAEVLELDGKRTNTSHVPIIDNGECYKHWVTNKFGTQILSENSFELICEMPNMRGEWPYGSEKFDRHLADAQFLALAPTMAQIIRTLSEQNTRYREALEGIKMEYERYDVDGIDVIATIARTALQVEEK